MINISESAQTHFRKLLEREGLPGLSVRLAASNGTPIAVVRLASPNRTICAATNGRRLRGVTLWLDAARCSSGCRESDYTAPPPAANCDLHPDQGRSAADSASLVERVHWLVSTKSTRSLPAPRHVTVQK